MARKRTEQPRRAFFETLSPPPSESLSSWADRRRILAAAGSAEPGSYRTSRVPALREIQDTISDLTIDQVVVMKSAQAGMTEVLVNATLRTIDVAPVPTLYVMPTLDMAQALMRTRIRPALEFLPDLAAKVRGRAMMHVDVDGAPIEVVGGRSTSALSSRAVGQLFGDELDRLEHDLDGEGDPWALAMARTSTFATRKIVAVSTPTIAGSSRIESLFFASDQRRLHVACPACGARVVPAIGHLGERDGEARWQCPTCSREVDEAGRMSLVATGEWRAMAASSIRGYHVWAFYSPWVSMAEILKKQAEAAHSPELAQTFANLVLGEPWSTPATTLEVNDVLALREDFGGLVPSGVRVLTMGVDTQDDGLVGLIAGWDEYEDGWLLGVVPFSGEPTIDAPWEGLSTLLGMPFPSAAGGALKIAATLVDCGGHHTDRVYRLTARLRKRGHWVYACKGYAGPRPVIVKARHEKGTAIHFMVGVDGAKASLYARLKRTDGAPPIHIPTSFDESLIRQLTSEQLVLERNKWGRLRQIWKLPRGRANEALDALVYGYAAMKWLAPTPEALTLACMRSDAQRLRLATDTGGSTGALIAMFQNGRLAVEAAAPAVVPAPTTMETPHRPPRASGSWLGDQRRWLDRGPRPRWDG